MKKAQFNLSVGFLVKIALGMAIFGVGIWLAFTLFDFGRGNHT